MGASGRRRACAVPGLLTSAAAVLILTAPVAWASGHDIHLIKLCDQSIAPLGGSGPPGPQCSWVGRDPATGLITTTTPDLQAQSNYRSLMSELGVVLAPRLVVPADSLGVSGFQVSAELGLTTIGNRQAYWNAAESVPSQSLATGRPSAWVSSVGIFARKGIQLPVPGFEVGAGVMHLLDSQMLSWQGYAKLALHEGFAGWPLPSLAVRGAASVVTGMNDARLWVGSMDVILSKAFGLRGTLRFEPFGGWNILFINPGGGTFDATPACDAYATRVATADQPLGAGCVAAQRGTDNDLRGNVSFRSQDVITRHRFFFGMKLRLRPFFLAAQYEITPAGNTRDETAAIGARDYSQRQHGVSLSIGLDF